jgi:sigma-E factor negative regulatory protein RseC
MALETGTVIKISGNMAQVQLERKSACTGCKACILGNSGYMLASAINTLGAKEGDRIQIEYKRPNQVRSGFILYILPLLAFVPGYLIGARAGVPYSQATADAIGFVAGIIGIAIAFTAIFFAQRFKNRKKPFFKMVGKLPTSADSDKSIK